MSDGGGHRQSRATLNETTNYARATRMTVTPNKKWCWFLGQYRRRLSWAADRRHDQNQASPPSGDDELELALVAARDYAWVDAYTGGRVPCLGLPGGAELRGQNEAKTYKGLPLVVSSIWNEAPFCWL